jgi:hypothetical protein
MGLAAVPTDFQSQYSVGRLVAGFGGYQSIMEFGPASMGPSLTAFSPPVIGTEESYLANTPLVGYGASTWRTGTPTVQWMWKDDDVVADIWGDSIDPDNSRPIYDANQEYWMQGYSVTSNTRSNYPGFVNVPVGGNHPVQGDAYFGVDYINQSGVWIQTANKEGVVILGNMSTGRTWYDVSDLNWEGMKHQWLIYSRTQMGKVASGSVASDQIQPARYTVQFPTIPYPASGTAGTATNDDGVTFPTSTSANLYGAQSATSATIGTPNCSPNYCFTVQAGLAYTPGMMMMALVPGGNIALGTWIRGLVKSYSGTSLVMDASWGTQGSGAHSSWSITGQQNGALPRFQCIGMAYDSINQNLYIAIRYASAAPALGDSVVYVYHVNDTGGGGDTTPPTVAVSTSSPQTITSDSLTITGTATDAVGVTGCKYRIGSEPDATHGTACTGTTSWSCAASGHSNGSNTDYVECYDAAGNYSSGHSIAVTYNPPTVTKRSKIGGQTINHAGFSGQ